jgi:5-methylcytosine-specific restriction endonuclease McrA
MSGKGGNNRRRSFRHQERNNWQENPQNQGKKKPEKFRFDKNRGIIYDRPKWTPVKPPSEPLPSGDCAYCGKPIRDIAAAISDEQSGKLVHFDCVIAKIAENEILERGDAVTYIGGGRFGVVHFSSPQETRHFKIKKILEWESTENRAEWRKTVADYFSAT